MLTAENAFEMRISSEPGICKVNVVFHGKLWSGRKVTLSPLWTLKRNWFTNQLPLIKPI